MSPMGVEFLPRSAQIVDYIYIPVCMQTHIYLQTHIRIGMVEVDYGG